MTGRRDLQGRTAVVTGTASGIGRALAVELTRQGCRLAISDVDEVGLQETERLCREARADVEVETYRLDVRDREAVRAHATEVAERFGAVHLVVNNAGVALAADVLDTTDEDLDWVLDVDLHGVIHGTRAFLPHLVASGDGHVINVSSIFGIVGFPTQSAYNAAKFGVRGFTEALAIEMTARHLPVRVTCVHPGGIATEIHHNARMATDEHTGREPFEALFERVALTSPEAAARRIVAGIRGGRRRVHIGLDARAIHLAERLLGASYLSVAGHLGRRLLRALGSEAAPHHTTPEAARASAGRTSA